MVMKSNIAIGKPRRLESKMNHKPGNLPNAYFKPSEGGDDWIFSIPTLQVWFFVFSESIKKFVYGIAFGLIHKIQVNFEEHSAGGMI